MFFEQQLEDVAYQYLLAKEPEEFIHEVLFSDSLPESLEAQDMFKTTEVYNTLSFNPSDNSQMRKRKLAFIEAFTDILKYAGLAIQSTIISDIDKLFTKDVHSAYEQIAEYFEAGDYVNKIFAILSKSDNLIDKASFIISQGNLSYQDLASLKNIKNFFKDVAEFNESKLECIKYDLLNITGFNYKNIAEIIEPLYEVAEQGLAEDTVDSDPQLSSIIKKKSRASSQLQSDSDIKPKPLSLEEALDKNFNDLIGLKDVKNAILGKTKLILKAPQKAIACNFRIVGNPGVGKTTVAEAMARTFFDAGIIKNPEFVSINGAELKAKYVGQTTGLVKKFFQQARHGTLFLDEVYSLLTEEGSGDSFTNEAITQLMTEIEGLYNEQLQDPTNKTLVIIAGYKDKVKQLMDKNIGFRRRFPNILELRDYNLEELEAIFNMFMKKDGFTLEDKAQDELASILERESKKENFSNAGYVRNLLQSAEECQARRADMKDFVITTEDLRMADKSLSEEQTNENFVGKIGF